MSNDIAKNAEYVKMVRQLPRPNAIQTALFASYVSNAHSWYKHLPLHPKVPFYFFLDPNVGKKIIYDQGGKIRFEEETSERGFHYTHQTTNKYRQRFGYWNYHAAYGTSFLLPTKSNEISSTESSIGLKILSIKGEQLEIPSSLIEIGTVYLSAFVHPHTNIYLWIKRNQRRILENDHFLTTLAQAPSILPEDLRFVWAVLNTEGWYPQNDNNLLINNEVYQNIFSKINQSFLYLDEDFLYDKSIELNIPFPKVLQAAEIARTFESRSSSIKYNKIQHDSKYIQIEENLLNHLVIERINQLESMQKAMNTFLDAIYNC